MAIVADDKDSRPSVARMRQLADQHCWMSDDVNEVGEALPVLVEIAETALALLSQAAAGVANAELANRCAAYLSALARVRP